MSLSDNETSKDKALLGKSSEEFVPGYFSFKERFLVRKFQGLGSRGFQWVLLMSIVRRKSSLIQNLA